MVNQPLPTPFILGLGTFLRTNAAYNMSREHFVLFFDNFYYVNEILENCSTNRVLLKCGWTNNYMLFICICMLVVTNAFVTIVLVGWFECSSVVKVLVCVIYIP